MGLSWINPLYLAGLLLLALPVLIHLVQKQHSQGVRFPSLMFLKQIPQREKQRLEIRHWLLLLLRCLLLLLVVLAFARPFFDSESAPGGLDSDRLDSVIVLDRSYSMRIADHWQQAIDAALQLVDRKQTRDRIGLVLVDDEAEVVSDLTSSADSLRSLLRSRSPGFKATRLPLAIEQAARLLAGSNASRKRIFVISDFQASVASSVARIGADIELTALPIEVSPAANASITSVAIEPSSRAAFDEFSLSVEVTNRSTVALDQEIRLTLDGRSLAGRKLRLAPGSAVSETFDRLSASGDLLRGIVSLSEDALALDNRHYFVYTSRQQLPLLLVEGNSPRANQSVFLQNALGLARNPVFRVERRALRDLKAEELSSWAAIILNDVSLPAGALADALGDFVVAGGGLLVVAATAAQPNWSAALLPGNPGPVVEARQASAYNMTDFEADHALTIGLGGRNTIDLSLARIFKYRELQPRTGDRVVSRYSDGGAALVERRTGQGRVLVLTTTLDTHWNDIALQPAFLPFLHQGLRYLGAYQPYPNQFEIGAIADLLRYARSLAGAGAIVAAATDAPLIVESPAAGEIRVDRQNPLLTLTQPGFYQVHHATAPGVEITLAANVDPHEANQQTLDVARFVEEIKASAVPATAGITPNRRLAAEYEQQQQLAYAIMLVVLALTLIESLCANWIGIGQAMRTRGTG
jgi:hypothetical protein